MVFRVKFSGILSREVSSFSYFLFLEIVLIVDCYVSIILCLLYSSTL